MTAREEGGKRGGRASGEGVTAREEGGERERERETARDRGEGERGRGIEGGERDSEREGREGDRDRETDRERGGWGGERLITDKNGGDRLGELVGDDSEAGCDEGRRPQSSDEPQNKTHLSHTVERDSDRWEESQSQRETHRQMERGP